MAPKHSNEDGETPNAKKQKMKEQTLPSASASALAPDEEPGRVVIHILEGAGVNSYGQLFEGIHVNRTTPAEQRRHYNRRWLARYQLAQLSTQPQGYQFTLMYPSGRTSTIRLLSPPDMVAERDAAGRWQRRQRDVAAGDEPQPHTEAFYQTYLSRAHLPPWFFRSGHLAMLDDTVEARLLDADLPILPQDIEAVPPTQQQRLRDRALLRGVHVAGGGIVNPTQIPAGLGRWEWLDSTDRDVARTLGYASSFEDVTNARGAGAFSLNPDSRTAPSVVFYSDPEYFNPAQEPNWAGHWAFLTSGAPDSDAMIAALQLGGTSGLPDYPTASQIFRLRQQYRAQAREDITASIRLVWVPGEEDDESEGEDPYLEPLSDDDEPGLFVTGNTPEGSEQAQDQEAVPGVLGEGIRASDFDPTNGNPGGKKDQTAKLLAPRYWTCRIPAEGGRIVTLDRARPKVGVVEEHKTYAYTLKGWVQHPGHAELDWSDKKQIAALARWRDQINRRHGWPKLRDEPREVYADDERAWIDERVREYLKAGKAYDIVATHQRFNARFKDRGERSEAGIGSIMLRLKRHWMQYGDSGAPATQQELEGGSEAEEEPADDGGIEEERDDLGDQGVEDAGPDAEGDDDDLIM